MDPVTRRERTTLTKPLTPLMSDPLPTRYISSHFATDQVNFYDANYFLNDQQLAAAAKAEKDEKKAENEAAPLPTQAARDHGNEPSRGAKIDEQVSY